MSTVESAEVQRLIRWREIEDVASHCASPGGQRGRSRQRGGRGGGRGRRGRDVSLFLHTQRVFTPVFPPFQSLWGEVVGYRMEEEVRRKGGITDAKNENKG